MAVAKSAAGSAAGSAVLKIQRYHLYWFTLYPTQGSEIARTCPALVVSPDAMNKRLETVVICPLTSQLHPLWASRVQCECAGQPADIAIDQIRTVSRHRLTRHIGKIGADTAALVRESIALLYATA